MTSGTVVYLSPPIFALYDLQFQAINPAQFDFPTLDTDGNWEFDSSFDIELSGHRELRPRAGVPVSGIGTAHATGIAPGGREPKVYDSEFVALNLYGLSPIPGFIFRESPTLPPAA